MAHGGKRPHAGRKSNAQLSRLRALTGEVATDKEWRLIIKRLVNQAKWGDVRRAVRGLLDKLDISGNCLKSASDCM